MKTVRLIFVVLVVVLASCNSKMQQTTVAEKPAEPAKEKHLYFDVHNLEPGKVTYDAVAGAHQKDLATQGKYGVNFMKYWVDEVQGKVYCLVESSDAESIKNSHREAHGLVPDLVEQVSEGQEAAIRSNSPMFLDVHHIGPGKVDAKAVAGAHEKDLAVQGKYGVNLVNYWVDEKLGMVMCLAEAPDADALVKTHKEAHGLLPDEVHRVKQGN